MEKSINFELFKPSVDYKIIHNLMIPPEIISSQRQELYANTTEDSYIYTTRKPKQNRKKILVSHENKTKPAATESLVFSHLVVNNSCELLTA